MYEPTFILLISSQNAVNQDYSHHASYKITNCISSTFSLCEKHITPHLEQELYQLQISMSCDCELFSVLMNFQGWSHPAKMVQGSGCCSFKHSRNPVMTLWSAYFPHIWTRQSQIHPELWALAWSIWLRTAKDQVAPERNAADVVLKAQLITFFLSFVSINLVFKVLFSVKTMVMTLFSKKLAVST